jgi:hypothetical protein
MTLSNSANILTSLQTPLILYQQLLSFTPTISGATTPGVGTYVTQIGWYYQIGKIVIANVNLSWRGHTGSGFMLLTSLPLTCANQTNFTPTFPIVPQNISLPTARINLLGEVTENTQQAVLYATRSNLTIRRISISGESTGTIRATIVYLSV